MKRFLQLSLTIFLLIVLTETVGAQNDIVLKIDGTEMIGKVIAIGETNVNFTYQN